MEAVTVRGLEEGFSLGGEGEIRWNGGMLGVVFGWERRKLESGLGCISVRGGERNKESVLGGVMEMGRGGIREEV